jgi:hypothetical protein
MLTNNYGMDLMTPSQASKDVVFNEAITKLDSFCNIVISSFESTIPTTLSAGAVHILNNGTYVNAICYCPSTIAGWKIQAPKKGMVFFVYNENAFFYFEGAKWEKLDITAVATSAIGSSTSVGSETMIVPKITGVSGYFTIPSGISKIWIYMSANSKVDINSATTNTITLLIKQHYQSAQNLEFVGNILWKDKTPYKISSKPNAIDIIRFHKISETDHWIAEIVGQGYEY